jgi:hypothetical protein
VEALFAREGSSVVRVRRSLPLPKLDDLGDCVRLVCACRDQHDGERMALEEAKELGEGCVLRVAVGRSRSVVEQVHRRLEVERSEVDPLQVTIGVEVADGAVSSCDEKREGGDVSKLLENLNDGRLVRRIVWGFEVVEDEESMEPIQLEAQRRREHLAILKRILPEAKYLKLQRLARRDLVAADEDFALEAGGEGLVMEHAEREGRLADPTETNDDGVIAPVVRADRDCGENALDALLAAKDDGRRRRWIQGRAARSHQPMK